MWKFYRSKMLCMLCLTVVLHIVAIIWKSFSYLYLLWVALFLLSGIEESKGHTRVNGFLVPYCFLIYPPKGVKEPGGHLWPPGFYTCVSLGFLDSSIFEMNYVTIKLIDLCSKPSEEIIIFSIKNIEFKLKISLNY